MPGKEKNRFVKLCLLTMGAYPVPATEGGAVETLVEWMAETYQKGCFSCSLDIISKDAVPARERAARYGKVAFHFIRYPAIAMKGYRILKRVVRKLSGATPVRCNPYFSQALRLIRKNRYDVVVVENAIWYVRPLKQHCSSRVILHLHNDAADLAGTLGAALARQADGIMAVSDFVAGKLRREPGMPQVVTVKNAIDIPSFWGDTATKRQAERIRRKFGFSPDDVVCLFVGRLIPEKGIDALIDAVGKLDGCHIKLLVVGGAAFRDSGQTDFAASLYRKAETLGGRVAFAGYVEYQKLPPYYHACDIAVFPSQCNEAAGLVVLEAQSAGKPVVIARSGGMPEYVCGVSAQIVETGAGFSDRLADALRAIGSSQPLRRRMGAAGAAYAAEFDKSGYFAKILDAIEQMI